MIPPRTARLAAMIDLLRQRRYSSRELAQHFGVSRRTIGRDLADLQAAPLYLPLVVQRVHVWYVMDSPAAAGDEP